MNVPIHSACRVNIDRMCVLNFYSSHPSNWNQTWYIIHFSAPSLPTLLYIQISISTHHTTIASKYQCELQAHQLVRSCQLAYVYERRMINCYWICFTVDVNRQLTKGIFQSDSEYSNHFIKFIFMSWNFLCTVLLCVHTC